MSLCVCLCVCVYKVAMAPAALGATPMLLKLYAVVTAAKL